MGKILFYCAILVALGASTAARAGAWEEILQAAEANDTNAVAGLIARGMDPNTSDQTGTTLLMIAARNGNDSLLELLLRNRSNTLIRNKYGDSAIALAAMSDRLSAVKRLVEYGVPISDSGWTPFQYAAFGGHADVLAYLIAKGAPIDAKAPNGETPLMLAAAQGHLDVVSLLIKSGADVTITDADGHTARDLALSRDHREVAEVLSQAPAATK